MPRARANKKIKKPTNKQNSSLFLSSYFESMNSLSFPATSNLNGEEVLDLRRNRYDGPTEQEESFDYTSSSEEMKNVTFQNLWTKEEVI